MFKTQYQLINYDLTKKVILFANVRDEIHIKEWVAHHLLIGFDMIYIFDHKSKIPLSYIFKNFDKRVKILNVGYLNGSIKIKLMNLAANIAKILNFDWMIYLDADEYFILNNNKFKGVKDFLNYYNLAHSISINWLMFGSNYLKKEPTELLIESYTKSELKLNKHVKTFVRPNEILHASNPHFYHIKHPEKMFGINGKQISFSTPYFHDLNISFNLSPVYIAHYFNQSEETFFKRKKELPCDDTGTYRNIDNINIHDQHNDVDNLYPKMKYSNNIKKMLEYFENL